MAIPTETTTAVRLDLSGVLLNGDLSLPPNARGLIVFAHGSGSSRHSSRNRSVAEVFQRASLGTLLLDLLTDREEIIEADLDLTNAPNKQINQFNDIFQDRLPHGYGL